MNAIECAGNNSYHPPVPDGSAEYDPDGLQHELDEFTAEGDYAGEPVAELDDEHLTPGAEYTDEQIESGDEGIMDEEAVVEPSGDVPGLHLVKNTDAEPPVDAASSKPPIVPPDLPPPGGATPEGGHDVPREGRGVDRYEHIIPSSTDAMVATARYVTDALRVHSTYRRFAIAGVSNDSTTHINMVSETPDGKFLIELSNDGTAILEHITVDAGGQSRTSGRYYPEGPQALHYDNRERQGLLAPIPQEDGRYPHRVFARERHSSNIADARTHELDLEWSGMSDRTVGVHEHGDFIHPILANARPAPVAMKTLETLAEGRQDMRIPIPHDDAVAGAGLLLRHTREYLMQAGHLNAAFMPVRHRFSRGLPPDERFTKGIVNIEIGLVNGQGDVLLPYVNITRTHHITGQNLFEGPLVFSSQLHYGVDKGELRYTAGKNMTMGGHSTPIEFEYKARTVTGDEREAELLLYYLYYPAGEIPAARER